MSTPATGLLSTIIASLEEHETAYHVLEGGCLRFAVAWERATHQFFVSANDELEIVTCVVTIGPRVPDARRVAAAEAIARINPQLGAGHFELDFDDGELTYRNTLNLDGGLLSERMVECMVNAALWSCERYVGPLMAVAFGMEEPVIAVSGAGAEATE